MLEINEEKRLRRLRGTGTQASPARTPWTIAANQQLASTAPVYATAAMSASSSTLWAQPSAAPSTATWLCTLSDDPSAVYEPAPSTLTYSPFRLSSTSTTTMSWSESEMADGDDLPSFDGEADRTLFVGMDVSEKESMDSDMEACPALVALTDVCHLSLSVLSAKSNAHQP